MSPGENQSLVPDSAPGDEQADSHGVGSAVLVYLIGLVLAIGLTATSFFVAGTDLVWAPSIPVALVVLAIAQMGVHLVFFLHITTGPDNTNTTMSWRSRSAFSSWCC
jgi:cytochrome o ubiquinol oxidase operon protein cyoD